MASNDISKSLTATSSAVPYARWIPPPKSKAPATAPQPPAAKIVFNDSDFPIADSKKSTKNRDEELLGGVPEKPRKSKKRDNASAQEEVAPQVDIKASSPSPKKRRKTEDSQEATIPSKDAEDVAPTKPTEIDDEEQKPKKDRKKKKKTKQSVLETAGTGEVDAVRKKHSSVFEKVEKALKAKKPVKSSGDGEDAEEEGDSDKEVIEPEEVHDLGPIPQPEPVVFDESKLTYETLPPWLASPIRVTDETRCAFTELGIAPESAKILESRGFKDAFAVQTAALPLLLPSADRQGDVVVAASTGSGKTLAYVLPMVYDISQGLVTRLRGIIVLPTRDLVQQVQAACEACVTAFAVNGRKRVKIATAMGNKVFKDEQTAIMGEEQKYDPAGYENYLRSQRTLVNLEDSDDGEDSGFAHNSTRPLPYHVVEHVSKVDILICTPGRLVEHINKTPGFTLDYVRWMIVDEADKLLAQDFQQWLGVVTEKLSTQKPGARDFPGSNKTGPRKVILSATMTRDLSLLNGLKLSRPRLIVLEGTKAGEQALPALLKESAIKVREPSLKPLYLVDLLNSEHLATASQDQTMETPKDDAEMASASESEASDSESSSSDSDSESDSSSSSSDSDEETLATKKTKKTKLPTSTTTTTPTAAKKLNTTVLIFTKSNEAALRLSRLLAILSPDLAPLIGTLTSSTKTSKRAQTLRAFARGKLCILVASDLVSRGIDLTNLDHVINYDLPISETSYVHRVGRTARAGRGGHAWTLVEHAEARRFWRDFAGEGKGASTIIARSGTIARVRVGGDPANGGKFSEERVKKYEAALEQLRVEAGEGRK
ncbi:P-loop containing nucleoside triphosphate hydrolase protein [Bombardia bombarda]|uniref:ATP-dependent RNA helicase n=1 Tax=Bombardia bombarda TaxID=252184 RepID=A0AA39XJE6_9PEZI|nr:P-loop containing nucleoside triphosphate hydrolase protein [Bombardia bombarda]